MRVFVEIQAMFQQCNTYNPAFKLILTKVEPSIAINLPENICNLANERNILRRIISLDICGITVIRAKLHEFSNEPIISLLI